MLVSYNWLKDYLGDDIPQVDDLVELITFHAFEVEEVKKTDNGDSVIDIKVLPDRASDCLSQRGIAREIATLLDKELKEDPLRVRQDLPVSDNFVIDIVDTNNCSRFMLGLVTNVEVKPSPAWLVERLSAIGQKSINNIVDATNYIMYALGQPMHAYDADAFSKTKAGKWNFVIRQAKEGESLALLKEKQETERKVVMTGSELLIVDGAGDLPVGLAGVKGGEYAGINADTRNIIIEAAHFSPLITRQTARKHNINTDAVKRFENNPSEILPPVAIANIVNLLKDMAGGELQGVCDEYPKPPVSTEVLVRTQKVNDILGLDLSSKDVKSILNRLGATIKDTKDGYMVTSPLERTDLQLECNYIDEIGRIHGLKNIKSTTPDKVDAVAVNVDYYYLEKIRSILLTKGFSEIMTSSFRNSDQIKLQNALASDKGCLRSSLVTNIKEALMMNAQNMDVLGLSDIRIFEIGKIFKKVKDNNENRIEEISSLTLGVQTKKTGYSKGDDKKLTEALIALKDSGILQELPPVTQGVCEIDLDEVLKELPVVQTYDLVATKPDVVYKPFSSYPAISRDIAMWVGEDVFADEVKVKLAEIAGPLCLHVNLFDEFAKDGRISYAFRLVFQAKDKTLTDEEVEPIMTAVYEYAKKAGFEVR